jgi:hypothetical protein
VAPNALFARQRTHRLGMLRAPFGCMMLTLHNGRETYPSLRQKGGDDGRAECGLVLGEERL